ncbi:IS110 family transposase [Sphingomonas sp. LB2R24]|uniref:IS110 family transposase n=1 Tax=Sphingomonas sorbitolis TaxID=3096165 RepID=UPI002FC947BA
MIGKVVVDRQMRCDRSSLIRERCRRTSWRLRLAAECITWEVRWPVKGHAVRLMSPEYVRPNVKARKKDDRDTEAIAEAATRPIMLLVELKTEEQLDMQTLPRIRAQLVGDRASLLNKIRVFS